MDSSLSRKKEAPYELEFVEGMINLCKLSILDQVLEQMKETNLKLRSKLKGLSITDFKAAMLVQLSSGTVAMEFNKQLAKEIEQECQSRGVETKKFIEQALPYVTGDVNVIFELENYFNLKISADLKSEMEEKGEDYEAMVTLDIAKEFYNKTVEYSRLLIDKKIQPQSAMIFPSMLGHFLYNQFGLYNVQVIEFTQKYLETDEDKFDSNFITLLFKEIYFSERGRQMIFQMMEAQMAMMSQMMGGGGMPPMDPSMMGGMPPMDPSMMGGMPPMDPSMMGGMPPMDPSMMGGMPPMDPSMMGGMPPMDPNAMGGMPSRKDYNI